MGKDIITLKEASELLNVHPNTLRKWDNNGLLQAVRIGARRDRRYKKEDVLRLVNKTVYVSNAQETAKVSSVRGAYYAEYAPLLADKAHLTSESVILDVPSGTGGMSAALAERGLGKKFYHVDINEEMIEAAKEQLGAEKHTFMVGDATSIDTLVPEQTDAILCLNGFHIYIDKKEAFLKACKNVLKDDGVLIFDISTRGLRDKASGRYIHLLQEKLSQLAKEYGTTLHIPSFPDDDTFAVYREQIKNAGLQLQEGITFDQWKSVDQLTRETLDIKGRLRPWLPNVTDEERVEIYEEASERAKKKSGVEKISHNRVFFVVTK